MTEDMARERYVEAWRFRDALDTEARRRHPGYDAHYERLSAPASSCECGCDNGEGCPLD